MKTNIIPDENFSKKFFFVGVGSILIAILVYGVYFSKLPPQVPLYYTKPWGEAQLVQPIFLLLPILMSLVFLTVNAILASRSDNYQFAKKALVIGASISSLLASITVIRIIFLII